MSSLDPRPDLITVAQHFYTFGLVEPTRQESGCLQYELLQNQVDPTDFTFVETWKSHKALDTHLASPHIQAALVHVPDLIAEGPDIRRYDLLIWPVKIFRPRDATQFPKSRHYGVDAGY